MFRKIGFAVLMLALTAVILCSCNGSDAGMIGSLSNNGQTDYKIVIAADAGESESYAASELSEYLGAITGAEFKIVSDSEPQSEHEIILGKTNRGDFETDYDALGVEGFSIKTIGEKAEKVVIAGQQRGLIYGVYTFLEEYCGCGFYAADCEVVPTAATLNIPAIDDTQTPYFEYRDELWTCANSNDYRMKRKFNNVGDDSDTEMIGGYLTYVDGYFCHTHNYLVDPSLYFEQHPEYFAVNEDGTRDTLQLCLSNPDVYDIAIEKAREVLSATDPNVSEIFSVTQNDNCGPCRCADCISIYREEGSYAATNIRFVNAIAGALGDEFPHIIFDTFAYQYTLVPPKITKPLDNVIIRMCSINICTSHPLSSGDSCSSGSLMPGELPEYYDTEVYKSFDDCLRGWSEISDRIYVWHYTTNYSHYVSPFPNFTALSKDVLYFYENNVKGVFMQGNYQAVSGEFGELRSYLISKLLWNPYLTEEEYYAEMDEFLKAYYGDGWEAIRRYIDLLEEAVTETHFDLYSVPYEEILPLGVRYENELEYLDTTLIDQLNACYDEAEAKTSVDSFANANVRRSRLALRYYMAFAEKDRIMYLRSNIEYLKKMGDTEKAAALSAEYETARQNYSAEPEQFYDDCVSFGIKRLREWGTGIVPKDSIDFSELDWLLS